MELLGVMAEEHIASGRVCSVDRYSEVLEALRSHCRICRVGEGRDFGTPTTAYYYNYYRTFESLFLEAHYCS